MSKETDSPKKSTTANFVVDFCAGGIAGAIAKTITAPVERVRLLIQTQDSNPRIVSGEVPRYKNIRDCFYRVWKEQGLSSFWRGNFTNILRYVPTQAFNFGFKEKIKSLFPKYNKEKEFMMFFLTNMASGGLAGGVSLCIVYPLDYARTRLSTDVGKEKRFNGLWDCLVKTAKGPGGVLSLYNGFAVSLAGIMPYRAVYFGLYDTLKTKNPYDNDKDVRGLASKFAVAQFTAISAGYASYPMDTVRRRLQMQSDKPKADWIYKGTFDCIQKILNDEGIQGFFKGAGANAIRTIGGALVLVLYDEVKDMILQKQ